jgi:prepilin-type N-terminal cleavage/methylation domain-containing protein/prepilin-type processing-associated H-X9-DG protein
MFEQNHAHVREVGRRGFTLIELLVTISIMATLMSMLFPALNRAREQAQRVVCQSNMRQLTMAWYMYANDNSGKLCSADTIWNDEDEYNHWVADGPILEGNNIGGTEDAIRNGVLWRSYAGRSTDLFKCKTDASLLLRSYSISRAMNGKTCNCEHDNIRAYRTLSDIKRGAEKMVFTDAISHYEWIDGSFCPIVDIEAVEPEWNVRQDIDGVITQNVTARHGDGCNISLADLHCEYWKWSDGRTVKLADWEEISPVDASGGNADLKQMVRLLRGVGQ